MYVGGGERGGMIKKNHAASGHRYAWERGVTPFINYVYILERIPAGLVVSFRFF